MGRTISSLIGCSLYTGLLNPNYSIEGGDEHGSEYKQESKPSLAITSPSSQHSTLPHLSVKSPGRLPGEAPPVRRMPWTWRPLEEKPPGEHLKPQPSKIDRQWSCPGCPWRKPVIPVPWRKCPTRVLQRPGPCGRELGPDSVALLEREAQGAPCVFGLVSRVRK